MSNSAQELEEAARKFSRQNVQDELWQSFAGRIFYHRSEFGRSRGLHSLAKRLEEIDAQRGTRGNRLFYLSVAPSEFEGILNNLQEAGLNKSPAGGWTRVIVEKPFGTDLAFGPRVEPRGQSHLRGAATLSASTTTSERRPRRTSWCCVSPTASSSRSGTTATSITSRSPPARPLGVEGRGPYYDNSGALRDMVQNHLLQLLCLTAMEPPTDLSADSVRDEKVKVVRSLRPLKGEDVAKNVVRGQYAAGAIDGQDVAAYRQEDRVNPESMTETFVALKVNIDNWRWAGRARSTSA